MLTNVSLTLAAAIFSDVRLANGMTAMVRKAPKSILGSWYLVEEVEPAQAAKKKRRNTKISFLISDNFPDLII